MQLLLWEVLSTRPRCECIMCSPLVVPFVRDGHGSRKRAAEMPRWRELPYQACSADRGEVREFPVSITFGGQLGTS